MSRLVAARYFSSLGGLLETAEEREEAVSCRIEGAGSLKLSEAAGSEGWEAMEFEVFALPFSAQHKPLGARFTDSFTPEIFNNTISQVALGKEEVSIRGDDHVGSFRSLLASTANRTGEGSAVLRAEKNLGAKSGLYADVWMLPTTFAEDVWKIVKGNVGKRASVGFLIKENSVKREGNVSHFTINDGQLREISFVDKAALEGTHIVPTSFSEDQPEVQLGGDLQDRIARLEFTMGELLDEVRKGNQVPADSKAA